MTNQDAESDGVVSVTGEGRVAPLNEDLAREYQAPVSYATYSQVLKGAQYVNTAAELEHRAAEELLHALRLAGQIDHLGGKSVTEPKSVRTSAKAEDTLRFDLGNALGEYADRGRPVDEHSRINTGISPAR